MTDDVDLTPVLTPLETIQRRGFNQYDVFRDWVELILAALQRDDDQYLAILEDYDRDREYDRGDRVPDLFAEAFGELQAAMADSNKDVLGMVYEEFGVQNEESGQHFTPHSAARMIAELQLTGEDPDPPVTIADPTCGSGRLLVHAARQHDVPVVCFGQDENLLCAMMAALNLCFFTIDGVIVCGDTLTMDTHRAWVTRGSPLGGEPQEVDPSDIPWPEAAFEESTTGETDGNADERLTVETDGDGVDQADLEGWMD